MDWKLPATSTADGHSAACWLVRAYRQGDCGAVAIVLRLQGSHQVERYLGMLPPHFARIGNVHCKHRHQVCGETQAAVSIWLLVQLWCSLVDDGVSSKMLRHMAAHAAKLQGNHCCCCQVAIRSLLTSNWLRMYTMKPPQPSTPRMPTAAPATIVM